jgi:DNA-binding NarL/FixJ family response regulator
VAEGQTNRQIGAKLMLSHKTVGRHMENIFARLAVSSRAAATRIAVREALIEGLPSHLPQVGTTAEGHMRR